MPSFSCAKSRYNYKTREAFFLAKPTFFYNKANPSILDILYKK